VCVSTFVLHGFCWLRATLIKALIINTMTATSKEEVKTIGNSKFSSKLKGLKFMQRAQEKKTSDDEKATTTTSLTTARTTTTTTTKATTTSTNKNDDEHWTYENPEEYERARKQKALQEQLASVREKKKTSNTQWVFGRRSFGGFNKAIEAMAREQQERTMKAKLAIRDARISKVDKKNTKKKTTIQTTKRKK